MPKTPDISAELSKAWRLLTSPLRQEPAFLLPGAPKSGTSSLFDAICSHPQVSRGARKEPTSITKYPGSRARLRMNFPFVWRARRICGDASVEYWSHPGAPAAASDVLPDAKLIVMLRDPVERAWSDYRMFRRSGMEKEDFTAVVERAVRWLSEDDARCLCASALQNSFNPLRYVQCGMYADLLEGWQQHFAGSRTLVLVSEEFFAAPEAQVRRAWAHLGLPPSSLQHAPRARISGDEEPVPLRAREILEKFYEPTKKRLAELLGRALPWS